MGDKEFKKAIAELRIGHVPANLHEVATYAYRALVDAVAFHEAAMECVERMQNDITVLRERIENVRKSD